VVYNSRRTRINAVVVMMGCSLMAQVANASTEHRAKAHHVQQTRHSTVLERSHEHRKTEHSRHVRHSKHEERAEHEERAKHTGSHRYVHRVRNRRHAVHHSEVAYVQRAPAVQEQWSTQTQGAPTWVLPPVCDQVLNYTGACQPAVLESLRVLGLQVPNVENREQMARHLQSMLDRQGLEQVQAQCQAVLLEDQRKINGLQTLLARAHVVASDDCSQAVQKLAAQGTVAQALPASVATAASDVAQAPVAASGQ
jgi:hypothetical protein